MKKGDLIRSGDRTIRVLELRGNKALVFDCTRKALPTWEDLAELNTYQPCTEENTVDLDTLDAGQRRTMYERYTLIAPVLPFLADSRTRAKLIKGIADENGMTPQTVKNYLGLYLTHMDITALAPKKREEKAELTQDEKNIRWALNKFFYTPKKQTLTTAYTLMLNEKYCTATGELMQDIPTFNQFRYFYRKTRKLQTFYISREGKSSYQRNHRPLVGEGVQQYAPAVGTAMLDSTICDIYLVNDSGDLVGRPILTACIDAYSGLCLGHALSWEGGVYSLQGLMLNVIADKVELCKRHGITIQPAEWPCSSLPGTLVTDMGSEYKSDTFGQITELGVKLVNLPPFRPELKGPVEKFFDVVQETYKKSLKGKGVIEPDFQERGKHDYRKDARLTLADFEKVILHCIVYYNAHRVTESFPFTQDMLAAEVQPYASTIWSWGAVQMGANLITVTDKRLTYTLLPRTTGKFSRKGLTVNKLRYHCNGYTEQYLSGGEIAVAYNPDDVSAVYAIDQGQYIQFDLIESRFEGMDLTAVEEMQTEQRKIAREAEKDNLQAQIDLVRHIEAIAAGSRRQDDISTRNIRSTRKLEQTSTRRDYIKEAAQ